MFGSKARLADKKVALQALRQARVVYKMGDRDTAAWFLRIARDLQKHAREHDYTSDDLQVRLLEDLEMIRTFQVRVLGATEAAFDNVWKQPTDPVTGDAMPCFPQWERTDHWYGALVVELMR